VSQWCGGYLCGMWLNGWFIQSKIIISQFWRLRKLKSSMAKYRVGIVGCGGIAHFHGKNYNRFDEFEIVSVADINRESVDQYAEEFSVSGKYTNYLDMFEEEDLDVVSVCTWLGNACGNYDCSC